MAVCSASSWWSMGSSVSSSVMLVTRRGWMSSKSASSRVLCAAVTMQWCRVMSAAARLRGGVVLQGVAGVQRGGHCGGVIAVMVLGG